MKTEIEVLECLTEVIRKAIKEPNIVIELDYPDIDNMAKHNGIFVQPSNATYEQMTVSTDMVSMETQIFICCKKASTKELIKRVFSLYKTVYETIKLNPTLGGFIDFTEITAMEYYPAVDVQSAIELSLVLKWERSI